MVRSVLVRLLPLAMLPLGCARTYLASAPNPQPVGQPLRTILVIASAGDPYLRQEVERRFAERGTGPGTRFLASNTVLEVGRTYNQQELDSLLKSRQVDGTLVISLKDSGSTHTDVPPSYGTTACAVYTVELGCQDIPSTTPGYSTTTPWANYSMRLYETGTGRLVWSASSWSEGTSYTNALTLARSMSDKTKERLADDGIIAR